MDEDKKIEIRDIVLNTIMENILDHGMVKDLVQDELAENNKELDDEESEYVYYVIDKICGNDELKDQLIGDILKYFEEKV